MLAVNRSTSVLTGNSTKSKEKQMITSVDSVDAKLKEHEFVMVGEAIIRLRRKIDNGAKIVDPKGEMRDLKKWMHKAGIEAGLDPDYVKDAVRVATMKTPKRKD
jgi:hypothetical protein